MSIKVQYFVYILHLGYFATAAADEKPVSQAVVSSHWNRAEFLHLQLNNVLQSKTIHIVDVNGSAGSMQINATYKNINTVNIANANQSLLADLIGTGLIKSPVVPAADVTAVISELKAQINSLNASVNYLGNLLTSHLAEMEMERERRSSGCSVIENANSVQVIQIPGYAPFRVLCDSDVEWIVIQRRYDGSIDFYRNWQAYRNGFGYYQGEFFLGLEYIHQLTTSRPYELYIELIDFENRMFYARYDNFLIGSEQEQYMLKSLGTYSGNAGDSLKYNLYDKFSTYDYDNDAWPGGSCANYYESGWWYKWNANR